MALKTHQFHESLQKGKQAEAKFLAKYEALLEQTDGRTGDFIIKATGAKVEIKSDLYDPRRTPNFFLEATSYDVKAGGPWQALNHGCEWFVYWFPLLGYTFCFRTSDLVAWLNTNMHKYKQLGIVNTAHVTTGILVPRSHLQDLWLDLDKVLSGEVR